MLSSRSRRRASGGDASHIHTSIRAAKLVLDGRLVYAR